jgi:hypothetical protein
MQQVYEKRRASIEAMVQSKGDISCSVDARAVFLPEEFFINRNLVEGISHDAWSRLQRTRVGQISMKHSFEVGGAVMRPYLRQANGPEPSCIRLSLDTNNDDDAAGLARTNVG